MAPHAPASRKFYCLLLRKERTHISLAPRDSIRNGPLPRPLCLVYLPDCNSWGTNGPRRNRFEETQFSDKAQRQGMGYGQEGRRKNRALANVRAAEVREEAQLTTLFQSKTASPTSSICSCGSSSNHPSIPVSPPKYPSILLPSIPLSLHPSIPVPPTPSFPTSLLPSSLCISPSFPLSFINISLENPRTPAFLKH